MLKLKKIAITGGLSSGKSTVSKLLEESGAFRINSDVIIHHLLSTNKVCIGKVVNLFGPQIINHNKIDRTKVANIVFSDSKKLNALEQVIHPMLFEELERIYKNHSESNCIIEMPLVQEIGKAALFDGVLAVNSDETIAKQRYIAAGHTEADYTRRMSRQWSPGKKAAHADFIIINNGSLEDLKVTVTELNTFN